MRLVPAFLAVALLGLPIAARADGDPARGAQVFKQCAICHMIGPHAVSRIGPPLNGVVGRVWGSWPNFVYSPGLTAGHAANKVWDEATLDTWLTDPHKLVPNTKMVFMGVHDPQQRSDVIAYLKQFDQDGNKK